MQKHMNYLTIDLDSRVYQKIKAVEGDKNSRFVQINLVSNNVAYDISNSSVNISGIKSDGTTIFNSCNIINAKEGIIEVGLTEQMSAVSGTLKCELKIYDGNGVLTTKQFDIEISSSITSKEIVSTNEFKALTDAINSVQNIDNKFAAVDEQFNTKASKQEVEVERQRINNFTKLSEGSTTGDAELIDARVGADGNAYSNLGTAIRSQFRDIGNAFNTVDTMIDGSVKSLPKELLQSGRDGKLVRLKNPNKKIKGFKALIHSDATTIKIGIANGDNLIGSGTIFFDESLKIFDKVATHIVTTDEIGKLVEIEVYFDKPISYLSDNIYIGMWGQKGNYNHVINENQYFNYSNKELFTHNETYKNYIINYDEGRGQYYINTSWGDGGNFYPAFMLITEELEVINSTANKELEDMRIGFDGTIYNSAGESVREQVKTVQDITLDVKNLFENVEGELSATVKSLPKELLQSGRDGKLVRLKNPNKKIKGFKALIHSDATTIKIGIGNGDKILADTIYFNNSSNIFDKVASYELKSEEVGKLTELNILFDEPVLCSYDNLYVAIWGQKGNYNHAMNELQYPIYANIDSLTADSIYKDYIINYDEGKSEYYINTNWGDGGKWLPAFKFITENLKLNEDSILESEEKPLDKIIETGGFTNIFDSIACIGDSLTEGAVEYDTGTMTPNKLPYSYPRHLQRMLGNTVHNMGRSGTTPESWLKYATTQNYFTDEKYKSDAYIIALGTNDVAIGGFTGDISTDISADYNNNANTSVGNYAKIIQKTQEFQPRARVFCVTIPYTRFNSPTLEEANNKIREIASKFNCYVIDLAKYGVQPHEVEDFKKIYYKKGHLNTLGYKWLANVYSSYIDYIIRNNPSEFWDVALINTDCM